MYNFVGEVAVRSFGDFPEMEKENLLTEIRNGNRAAFDELCREELPVLLSYARAFLYDKWADDVVQDVLFSFWKNRESLKSDCAVRRYLLRSVYNRSLNYIRSEKLSQEFRAWNDLKITELGLEGCDPDRNPVIVKLMDNELRDTLTEAIGSLPPKSREVFIMSYLDDMSNKEISAKLGISLSTVENHIYKALKLLRSSLSDEKSMLFIALLPYLTNSVSGIL